MNLKLPYPYFGGKAKVAPIIWQALGSPSNYVEPFFGGGAALLLRPDYNPLDQTETVNDLDCNIANFWRCLQGDPEQLAKWADWPVSETDLHARHQWLVNRTWGADSDFRERMTTDPDFCDYKQAGWWVWGICQWIGTGWCADTSKSRRGHARDPEKGVYRQRPDLSKSKGIQNPVVSGADDLGNNGMGVHRKRPHLGNNGMGVHRKRPHAFGVGNEEQGGGSPSASTFGGQRDGTRASLYTYFEALAQRTRRVRVCCGDFERVLGPTPTTHLGLTGVLLDPPYDQSIRHKEIYACESDAAARAREWAIANGDNPKLRIVLCGYEGEHAMPEGWRLVRWKAGGGYGSQGQGRGRANAEMERLWLSPHCLVTELEDKARFTQLSFA